MVRDNGNPKKVLRKAAEIGVHADCIASDLSGSCDECISLMHQVYAFYYGHLETAEEVVKAIMEDLRRDRMEALGGS